MHLKNPFPSLLSALGKPDSSAPFIMPERLARTDPGRAVTEMVGSGPYRFVAADYVSGSRVAYERFDGYVPRQDAPDWASGAKVAHFPRVEWLVIPDAATALAALTKGEVDWWEQPLPDLQPSLASDPAIAMQMADPAGRIGIMRLNHLHPPFNDLMARRAVLLAIDQEDMMRAAVGDDTALWATCRGLYPRHTPYFADLGDEFMPASISAGQAALKASRYAGERVAILEPTDNPVLSGMCQVASIPLGQVYSRTAYRRTITGIQPELALYPWGVRQA